MRPRCVARPFDGHLTLIDRSTWRDGAFNRADSRARIRGRSPARLLARSLASDALSAMFQHAETDEWFMGTAHVALARRIGQDPAESHNSSRDDDDDDDVARVSTCLTPPGDIPLSND